ncbi:MAG: carbon starvation protein A [Candidatus Omnitrophica bacterium]|nr:carbon starvation protein A [Candidatus Omnitrophota bacterium]MBU1047732.1 carbon starvation protein A [Candidatus Omnitrophota bacterium]MBU1631441.1 carbon starvation protein A [Candidatus Omnitrophota bacterium]MBU1767313.1 carbon starvation protein A [Candidatus Omnitrophota bacterium]MBU1888538.1 carbon starvation protein A [Candidatus Omnitrophota bacterium]
MHLTIFFIAAVIFLFVGYIFYGKMLGKIYELNDKKPTPAHTLKDGIDHVPTGKPILLGHHFSSIAGAGPIIGPISGAMFGWLPVLLWIIIGSVFLGGVHDFSALVSSIRNKALSLGELIKNLMGKRGRLLFLIFSWLTLVLVIAVFFELTKTAFIQSPGIATSSILYIVLAVVMGTMLYIKKTPLLHTTIISLIFLFAFIHIGQKLPLNQGENFWIFALAFYCFCASILPVWLLLQPRDYLSSFLLYASAIGGFVGIVIGGYKITYPMYTAFNINGSHLYPILFVTVACGAISGFHSLVSSGTTSKQLNKESDAKFIGYGSMIIEGLVAVIALSTVMIISKERYAELIRNPLAVYANGMGIFLSKLGFSVKFGESFAILALSTFILTTLDTATRIGRYTLSELLGEYAAIFKNKYISTLVTIGAALFLVLAKSYDLQGNLIPAWKIIWPVFGASNQLLASLVLLSATLYLISKKKRCLITLLPLLFMLPMTIFALISIAVKNLCTQAPNYTIGISSIVLILLALLLVLESVASIYKKETE